MDFSNMKGLRRHYGADIASRTKLTYAEHASQSGICSICTKCGNCEIALKAKTGRTLFPEPFGIGQFGAEKRVPNLEDVQILPELFGEGIIFKTVKTETKIGGFNVALPITMAAMGSTKVAHVLGMQLAAGAAKAGIPMAVGENVMTTYGEAGLKERVKPYLDNYEKLGALLVQGNVEERKIGIFEKGLEMGAHGIEIKLGQGAKMCLGGEIRFKDKKDAEKYKKLGYMIIQRDDGTFERHCSPGSITEDGLKEMLVKYSEFKVPIWIKVGIGNGIDRLIGICQRIKKEQRVPLEAIVIDGHGGGTGMSPWLIMNECSIASVSLLPIIEKVDFDIILAGGIVDGMNAAKAMMMGADGVSIGRAFLIAATIAGEKGIENYVKALKEEMQMVCATQKVDNVEKLKNRKENLIALSHEAATMFDIKEKLKV
jgi:isopentenyl diphosphate isomerase/L-lactate dehydrogenase-like FMN-dependent dehydrogenase